MEVIKTIIQRADVRNVRQQSQTSLPASEQRTRALELDRLLVAWNPARQTEIAADTEAAFAMQCPTLAELRRDYGTNAPIMWLAAQLYDLCEYTGARKMDAAQIEAASRTLYAEAYYMTLAEWQLFFARCKAGRYGKFYGVVDAMALGSWLQEFKRERDTAHERRIRRENVERINAGRADAVTYKEYQRRKRDGLL